MRALPIRLARLVVVPLALLVFASPVLSQPSTGEQQTYAISLEQGVNLVALPVVPDNAELSVVIADILPKVSLVQSDRGMHVIPSLGINDIGVWSWKEAYKVHTTAPATLVIQGAGIVPDLSPLVLEAGAHWVPYLRNADLPVEEAFATILPNLRRAEDGYGRVYEPGNQSSTLDRLRVGEGYRVWLAQRDTLLYPVNQSSGGGGAIQVGTLAEALALRGLAPGQEIEMLGYYTPGDGGGGRFLVENTGAATDGGLVHVPNEHVSPRVTEVVSNDDPHDKPLALPSGTRVVYGSVTLELLRPSGNVLGTIDGRYLHGHEWAERFVPIPLIDYESGEFDDQRRRLAQWCNDEVGDMWSCDLRITYRHTTSGIRLRRTGVSQTLNAHWFGARPRSDAPAFDNQPVLGHVINVANSLNGQAHGTITTVLLPSPETYEYFGSLQIGDGLTLKGGGGTELATVTNDLGHTYQPVRIKQSATHLRLKDGEALAHIRMEKSASSSDYLPPDIKHRLHSRQTAISVAPGAVTAGLKDIVLDGNWEGNRQAWEDGWATHTEKETWMRNTPSWSGFISTRHNGVPIPMDQVITLRNVAIVGYGATGVLGDINNTWNGENVLLGNSVWNHALYRANGNWTNLTFTGFAWGHAAWYAGEINNLVFENGIPGPYRPGQEVFEIRGGDAFTESDLQGNPEYTRADGTVLPLGTTVDGFYIDLRGSRLVRPIGGLGPRVRLLNGRVILNEEVRSASLFNELGNGYQKALYPEYEFENIVVYDNGELGRERLFGTLNVTNSSFRNISTDATLLGSQSPSGNAFRLRAYWRNHYAWDDRQTTLFSQIYADSPQDHLANVYIHPNSTGAEYYIYNSRFNNLTNTLYENSNGTGELSQFEGDLEKINVYMDGVEFKLHNNHFHDLEIFLALTQLRNCTDTNSGRTSEDSGTFTFTASGGETQIGVPTGLLWEPLDSSFTTVTEGSGANGLLHSFEYRAPDGSPLADDRRGPNLRLNLTRALAAGEQVTFSWEAAVRPWDAGAGNRPADAAYGSNNPLTRENGR